MYNYVGKNIPRRDAFDKVTGKGVFTHDVSMPNMLYAKVLRSPHAHAKILSIDTSKAEALPGVKAVATYKNTTQKLFNTSATMVLTVPTMEPVYDQRIFDSVVRYVGDEVAAVTAISEEIAAKACKLIEVEYELLPAVFDPLEAMKEDAPIIHPSHEGKNIPGEIVAFGMGDFNASWAEADVFAEAFVKLPIQKQAQMETHAALAYYKANGELEICSTTQTVHPTKTMLGHLFEIPESKIHVYNPPYVGGGFGVRIGMSAKAEPIAAALSMLTSRPVKLIYDREEDFMASDTRHSGYVSAKLCAKKDGTFLGLQLRATLNTGAYCSFGVEVPGVLGSCGPAVYRLQSLDYSGHSVYTNIVPAGAMRGFGTPQAMFAIEEAVDSIAKQLNMDPLELRQQNIMKPGDKWFLPYPCGSTLLDECIDKAAASIGWSEKRGKTQEGPIRRGVGIAVGTHVSNAWPFCVDYNNIYLRIEADGSLHMATGVPDIGSGTTTSLPQIAAEVVGVSLDTVQMVFSDTNATPFDIGSHASRTLYTVGLAISKAGKELKDEILEYAGKMLEVSPTDLTMAEGIISGGGKTITLKEVAYNAHLNCKQFIAVGRTIPPNSPPWHAHAAEVEVDLETGMVRVIKVAAAHDIGKAINPAIVEGQVEGGVAMGIGYATREEMTIDEKGHAYNTGFHKYMLPTIGDMPEIDTILVESHDPAGPFGAKGIGECGLIPTAPAIVAAVEDAIGIRFHEIPLTPVRVLSEINKVYGTNPKF